MFEILLASCLIIDGAEYCQTGSQQQVIQENRQEIIEHRQVITNPQPIHVLDTSSMSDPRYGSVFFQFQSTKGANDCVESLLYILEDRPQSFKDQCAHQVISAFGDDFKSDKTVQTNVFRMWGHYVRNVLKREPLLPKGLDRRLEALTGLTTF